MPAPQGDDEVAVEVRKTDGQAFGRGRKQRMPASQFFDLLDSPESLVYLSTQDAPVDFDGQPRLLGPPLAALEGLPIAPRIARPLVPQSINIWMGASAGGTSSGLHHDFHDNLYVLLKGTKRFRLFPPDAARRMYVHGDIDHIYENGRCGPSTSFALRRAVRSGSGRDMQHA